MYDWILYQTCMLPDILIIRVLGENSTQDLPRSAIDKPRGRSGAKIRSDKEHLRERYKGEQLGSTIDLLLKAASKRDNSYM